MMAGASWMKRAHAVMDRVGADFDEWGPPGSLIGSADLPAGKVWRATGTHTLAVNFHSDRYQAWKTLYNDVRQGTEPCAQKNCDICEGR